MTNIEHREKVIYEGQASYIINSKEHAVGRMAITEESVIFHSYHVTMNQASLEIRRNDIDEVEKLKTVRLIPNKLKITMKNGEKYTFMTWDQEKMYKLLMDNS